MKTKKEAIAALAQSVELRTEAEALLAKYEIPEMLAEADALKKEVAAFCIENEIEKLDIPGGKYGRMIQAVNKRIWVGTKSDIPPMEDSGDVKPLKSLVTKKVWMKITRRVPDPELIQDAVDSKLITLEQIAPAYVEEMRTPYMAVYDSENGNGKAKA